MNKRPRLPRYILFVLDKDILEDINLFESEAAMIKAFGVTLDYFANRLIYKFAGGS